MSTDGAIPRLSTRLFFSPMAVLLYVYAVYFLVGLSRVYEFVYWELMNFGLRMIGYQPTAHTVVLYAYAGLVLVLGFLLGHAMASRVSSRSDEAGKGRGERVAELRDRIARLPLVRSMGVGFALSLVGWGFAAAANMLQLAASGRASLFDIATRWSQSPVLVFLAALNIIFVPALIVFARSRWHWLFVGLASVVAVGGLGLLGARHLPAKLLVAAFLALAFVIKERHLVRVSLVFVALLVLVMGVIGAVSKAGIYGPTASANLAVALTYADSAGTTYNLDRIVRMTPPTGVWHGRLLHDSALALVPGTDYEYANYQLGRYLGGREYFEIGGVRIDRSVSLAPTLIGAPYADWGVPGVVGQMLLLGALFGYLQARGRAARWVIPVYLGMAAYVINGVNAGVHNPNAIAYIVLALLVCLVDYLLIVRAPALYGSLKPEETS
jgi:hypothetical protein